MAAMNPSTRYDGVSQLLHWAVVLLVLVLLIMGKAGLVDADHPGSAAFMWHGSLGVLVLVLVAARALWRLRHRPPEFPATMTRLGRIAARTMHASLYVLLIALPLSGWIAASSEGSSVNFFNVATLPRWGGSVQSGTRPAAAPQARAVPESEEGAGEDVAEEVHELLGDALIVLASLHVLAALKHQYIDHDELIRRMLPGARPKAAGTRPTGG